MDGRNYRLKHVELILINKIIIDAFRLLFISLNEHLVVDTAGGKEAEGV